MRTRRIAEAAVGCVLALAGVSAVLAGDGQTGSVPLPMTAHITSTAAAAGNQAATQLLASAPLPSGWQPWTAAPPPVLDNPPETPGLSNLTDLHALYLVGEPAAPTATGPLASYVLARFPGASIGTSNSGGGPGGDSTGFTVSLPTSGKNEYLAALLYETTAAPAGGYVLRVDAQVVWVANPPAAEVIPTPASAQLTGYATTSLMNASSGPVTVILGEAESVRLAEAVNALPPAPQAMCMEHSLLYTITFFPQGSSGQTYVVSGDQCTMTVGVSTGPTQLPPLSDAGCTLLRTVIGQLPPTARGTDSAAEIC